MSVQCIDCKRFDLQGAGRMAREGFGLCTVTTRSWQFFSATYPRQCTRFEAAPAQQAETRRQWHAGRRSAPTAVSPVRAA